MVTIKVFLDKRRITKEQTYPLNFRIYYSGKSATRSCKIFLTESQWDDKKKVIRKHPDAALLNRRLQKDYADLQSVLLLADDASIDNYLTPKIAVKLPEKVKLTVFEFTQQLISELRIDNRIGNAWVYEAALNALRKFHSNTKLHFEDIDFKFLDQYNKHLLSYKQDINFL